MRKLLFDRPVKSFMRVLRKTNDIRVSSKFMDALRRHLYAVLQDMCRAEGNEKRITEFHLKVRGKNAPSGLVRESVMRKAIVEIRSGPTQISKSVYPKLNAYTAAVCRASVDAAGDTMTVTHLMIPPDSDSLPVRDKRSKSVKQKVRLSQADYKDRRRLTVSYSVKVQGATLEGTKYPVSAYGNDKLKRGVTNDIRRFFDHLGIHGDIEVNIHSIEVRK